MHQAHFLPGLESWLNPLLGLAEGNWGAILPFLKHRRCNLLHADLSIGQDLSLNEPTLTCLFRALVLYLMKLPSKIEQLFIRP